MHRNQRLIILECRGAEVDVKKLPKRPAPPAFGRKLTDAQKARRRLNWMPLSFPFSVYCISLLNSSEHFSGPCHSHMPWLWVHIHPAQTFWWASKISCPIEFYRRIKLGFVNKNCKFWQPDEYSCPQCRAPKKRFAKYDVKTGKAIGGGLPPIGVIVGLLVGVGGVGALLVYGLQ